MSTKQNETVTVKNKARGRKPNNIVATREDFTDVIATTELVRDDIVGLGGFIYKIEMRSADIADDVKKLRSEVYEVKKTMEDTVIALYVGVYMVVALGVIIAMVLS